MLRTLSDLGGGVNGHDANLRDKCGVCDDEEGGWGGVGGGAGEWGVHWRDRSDPHPQPV